MLLQHSGNYIKFLFVTSTFRAPVTDCIGFLMAAEKSAEHNIDTESFLARNCSRAVLLKASVKDNQFV